MYFQIVESSANKAQGEEKNWRLMKSSQGCQQNVMERTAQAETAVSRATFWSVWTAAVIAEDSCVDICRETEPRRPQ